MPLLISLFFLSGCSTEISGKQTYKDDQYNFSLNYSSNWQFINFSGNKLFIKKPLTQNDIEAGKVTDNDCVLRFNNLNNSAGKSLDDFWASKSNKITARLGNNNFIEIASPNNGITYSVADTNKQIFVFDGSSSCKSDNEGILSTLTFD